VSVAAAAVGTGSLSRLTFAGTPPIVGKITEPANGDKSAIRPFRVHVPEAGAPGMRPSELSLIDRPHVSLSMHVKSAILDSYKA
jgi:hypothetical protein